MIYVTGDTHGELIKFVDNNMPGESEWGADDVLIVCGDFGFVWEDNLYFNRMLDFLEAKPYTIAFVDGNHEAFHLLYEYPLVEKFGNRARQVRSNIFHLQRGLIYTIEGKTFFTFGGAHSIDKEKRLALSPEGSGKPPLWWKKELPNEEEYARGIASLKAAEYRVDYVITHTAPNTVIKMLVDTLPLKEREKFTLAPEDSELRSYLDIIWHNVKFRRWFFGHWHKDKRLCDKARALLLDVEEIY